jgi:hypothetical protein
MYQVEVIDLILGKDELTADKSWQEAVQAASRLTGEDLAKIILKSNMAEHGHSKVDDKVLGTPQG